MKKLILIKFGGSLITDKNKINTARSIVINNLSMQIKEIIDMDKDLSLIIATGAGGFGHPLAEKYQNNLAHGLPKIKKAVKKINRMVVDSLNKARVKAASVEPSKIAEYKDGKIVKLLDGDIVKLLEKNIIPVFHADLINDQAKGISILSMDRFLVDAAINLKNKGCAVKKVIFCGTTDGVLDYKGKTIKKINQINFPRLNKYFFANSQVDTSGGMKGKVTESLKLIDSKINCIIINGQKRNNLKKTALGQKVNGTVISK